MRACPCHFSATLSRAFQDCEALYAIQSLKNCRQFTVSAACLTTGNSRWSRHAKALATWAEYQRKRKYLEDSCFHQHVGFIGKRRDVGKKLSFADLTTPSGHIIQLCSNAETNSAAHEKLRQTQSFTPVCAHGFLEPSNQSPGSYDKPTVQLSDISQLNSMPEDLVVTSDVHFPPQKRHLQIRFHPELQARLRFRSWLKGTVTEILVEKGFTEIDTPTLFKSTSEGAKEFLVPTRQPGQAYALTQSPQQYKQVLMASGISRYMQWAHCYRDEDPRTDRQPEFLQVSILNPSLPLTSLISSHQLDLEWAFSGANRVRQDVSTLINETLNALQVSYRYRNIRGQRVPVPLEKLRAGAIEESPSVIHDFETITFADSIAAYGTDKPDLRIPNRIYAIPDIQPIRNFVRMISHLAAPVVEVFKMPLNCSPAETRKFVKRFMEALPAYFHNNPDGSPQILIHDSGQPLNGLSPLGFEFEDTLKLVSDERKLHDGDILVFQARKQHVKQLYCTTTKIGELRGILWKALVKEGLIEKPPLGDPASLKFVWVTEFPMFKRVENNSSGAESVTITASHHPFTAPLSEKDLELLLTEPLQAKSAAYDLVLNGVEIGGGSERIHISSVQSFVLRDVLRLDDTKVKQFDHLFEALKAGCPPHAGFALGFDRFVALLTDTSTVRDVMAFPKNTKGDDPFVHSPSELSDVQLEALGLQFGEKWRKN